MSELKTRITKVQVIKPPTEEGEACLVLIYPPGSDMGKRFPLDRDELVIGRGADCDIQVDYDSVSRRHARVYRGSEGFWVLEDLGSTNGSYVDDMPVSRSPLHDANFLKIGAAIFKFLAGAGIEASYYEEIYRMTIIDGLTGVHNKRYFLEFLEREIARCARHQRPLSLLMFDIDHFKPINDKFGHPTGDAMLRQFGHTLKRLVRNNDFAARYGGDEFAMLLPYTSLFAARLAAERIRKACAAQPILIGDDNHTITVSIGVSTAQPGQPTDHVIACADMALYAAKEA
ncbi:MAG: diguanylate cyclase, partial [Maricaulaceae bacterium]